MKIWNSLIKVYTWSRIKNSIVIFACNTFYVLKDLKENVYSHYKSMTMYIDIFVPKYIKLYKDKERYMYRYKDIYTYLYI